MNGKDVGILTTMVIAVLTVCAITFQLHSVQAKTNRPPTAALRAHGSPAASDDLSKLAGSLKSGDFNRARDIVEKFDDERVRGQLSELIRFSEAGSALEKNQVGAAMLIASGYPAGIRRGLLLIAIASFQARSGDFDAAADSLRLAVGEARHAGARPRAQLLAMASRVFLSFDRTRGEQVLADAVREYRAEDGVHQGHAEVPSSTTGIAGASFYEVVRASGGRTQIFPLRLPGAQGVALSDFVMMQYPAGVCAPRHRSN